MNGMNFKPFISKLLDSLSDKDIGTFASLIDRHSNDFKKRLLSEITTDDKGVGLFTIQLDKETIRTGYLVYNDNYCVLLGYVSNSERVVEYELDLTTQTYVAIKEYLTTDYLRHEVAIRATAAGELGDVVEIKEVNTLPTEGEEDTIYLSETNGISEGLVDIPVPNQSDIGKVLQVGNNGKYGLEEISGGTKLYRHRIVVTEENYQEALVDFDIISISNKRCENIVDLYNLFNSKINTVTDETGSNGMYIFTQLAPWWDDEDAESANQCGVYGVFIGENSIYFAPDMIFSWINSSSDTVTEL